MSNLKLKLSCYYLGETGGIGDHCTKWYHCKYYHMCDFDAGRCIGRLKEYFIQLYMITKCHNILLVAFT